MERVVQETTDLTQALSSAAVALAGREIRRRSASPQLVGKRIPIEVGPGEGRGSSRLPDHRRAAGLLPYLPFNQKI